MRQFIFFAGLCCTLLVSVCYADDKRLIIEQENVAKQMEESRAAAHKAADAWESHIEKLNAEVLPEDHFSHNPAKVSTIIKKHADHRAIVKSSVQHVKPHSYAPVQHKAAVQAAAYLKHLDHLSEETLPHMNKAPAKWHTETAAQLLAHDRKVAVETNPSEYTAKVSAFHDTAKAMYARRKAEVDAAFPASWTHSKAKKTTLAHGTPLNIGQEKKWAEQVAFRQNQLNKYQSDRLKEKEQKANMQTNIERQNAAQQATRELTHLSKISDEVWPSQKKAATTKAAAVQRPVAAHALPSTKSVAAPHGPQHRPRDWRTDGSPAVQHPASRHFPKSSDSTIPSAGTDIAYIGAHQAGFARKLPPQAAAAAHPVHARIYYPFGTVADDGVKARAKGPAPERDIKAAHQVHRQAVAAAAGSEQQVVPAAAAAAAAPKPHAEFSPTFAVKMERAAKRAARGEKSARAEPTSSDLAVPEMGTNVVFQGASASGSTGEADHGAVPN